MHSIGLMRTKSIRFEVNFTEPICFGHLFVIIIYFFFLRLLSLLRAICILTLHYVMLGWVLAHHYINSFKISDLFWQFIVEL